MKKNLFEKFGDYIHNRKLTEEDKQLIKKARRLLNENPDEWYCLLSEEEYSTYLMIEDLSYLKEIRELGMLFDKLKNQSNEENT